jgi:hypothetical protein
MTRRLLRVEVTLEPLAGSAGAERLDALTSDDALI